MNKYLFVVQNNSAEPIPGDVSVLENPEWITSFEESWELQGWSREVIQLPLNELDPLKCIQDVLKAQKAEQIYAFVVLSNTARDRYWNQIMSNSFETLFDETVLRVAILEADGDFLMWGRSPPSIENPTAEDFEEARRYMEELSARSENNNGVLVVSLPRRTGLRMP